MSEIFDCSKETLSPSTWHRRSTIRSLRVLVFKRIATLDLAGGIVATMNRKLRVWQNDMREAQQQPSWGEWFEWLGDQAEKVKRQQIPAHVKYRDWVP